MEDGDRPWTYASSKLSLAINKIETKCFTEELFGLKLKNVYFSSPLCWCLYFAGILLVLTAQPAEDAAG